VKIVKYLLIILFCLAGHRVFAEAPVLVQVLTFPGNHLWEGTESLVEPIDNEGHYRTRQAGSTISLGDCSNLLESFQRRPLTAMFEKGYITKDVFESLQKLGERSKPRQFTLITLFTAMTRDEALKTFQGKIPEERIIRVNGLSEPGQPEKIAISRGTLYAIEGQIIDISASRLHPLEIYDVAWEMDLPKNLTRKMNRKNIRALVEIGRANSEKGDLGGDHLLAAKLLTAVLYNKYRILGIPPEEVIITAHALDSARGKLFLKGFPFRLLTPEIQIALESDPVAVLSNYMKTPLPQTHAEWRDLEDIVVYGSLAEFLKSFPLDQVSQAAYAIPKLPNVYLNSAKALDLKATVKEIYREDFTYVYIDGTVARGPLMMRDRGSPLLENKARVIYEQNGIPFGSKQFYEVQNYTSHMGGLEPDLFLEGWIDPSYYVSAMITQTQTFPCVLDVSNLDSHLAIAHPYEYVASVVLSVEAHIQRQLDNLVMRAPILVLDSLNNSRKLIHQASVTELTSANYIEAFPIFVSSSDTLVQQQLKAIGGNPKPALVMYAKFDHANSNPGDPIFNIGFTETNVGYYEFSASAIAQIRKQYPQLINNAANRLKKDIHRQRLMLNNAVTF
jgi:hypothetical protein